MVDYPGTSYLTRQQQQINRLWFGIQHPIPLPCLLFPLVMFAVPHSYVLDPLSFYHVHYMYTVSRLPLDF